jgi:hypothetical protein
MRPTVILAAVAAAACAAVVGPTATAAADESVYATIGNLEAAGYTVNIDRVGSAPLQECIVTSVRNPQTVTKLVRVFDGKDKNGDIDWDFVEVIVSRSISVSLDCTR